MILKSGAARKIVYGSREMDFFCYFRNGKLILHPARTNEDWSANSSYRVDYNTAHIYQAWPPRAWLAKGKGERKRVKRVPFDLNINRLLGLMEKNNSKKIREFMENARIWRTGYKHGPDTKETLLLRSFQGEENRKFRKAVESLPFQSITEAHPIGEFLEDIPKKVKKGIRHHHPSHGLIVMCSEVPGFTQLLNNFPMAARWLTKMIQTAKPGRFNREKKYIKISRLGKKIPRQNLTPKQFCHLSHKKIVKVMWPDLTLTKGNIRQLKALPKSQCHEWRLVAPWIEKKEMRHIPPKEFSLDMAELHYRWGIMGGYEEGRETAFDLISHKLFCEISKASRKVTRAGHHRRDTQRALNILKDATRLREIILAAEHREDLLEAVPHADLRLAEQEVKFESVEEARIYHDTLDEWNRARAALSYQREEAERRARWAAGEEERAKLQKEEEERRLSQKFPEPPIPGWGPVTPLHSPRKLILEGQEMRHCVGSYDYEVKNGTRYMYHIELDDGEKATLELCKAREHWYVGQFYGPCNQYVSEEMREVAQCWLERHPISPLI